MEKITTCIRAEKVEYKKLTDSISIFNYESVSKPKLSILNTKSCGFIYTKDIPKTVRCPVKGIVENLYFVTPKLLRYINEYGFTDDTYKLFKSEILENFYENIENHIPIFIDYSLHMIFDVNKKVLPTCIYFDYIQARLNSSNYDLNAVLKVLWDREDVYNIDKYMDLDIKNIPYYNNDTGNEQFISFRWVASIEDYKKMWDKCLKYKCEYPSCRMYEAIAALDLLGIEKYKIEGG